MMMMALLLFAVSFSAKSSHPFVVLRSKLCTLFKHFIFVDVIMWPLDPELNKDLEKRKAEK